MYSPFFIPLLLIFGIDIGIDLLIYLSWIDVPFLNFLQIPIHLAFFICSLLLLQRNVFQIAFDFKKNYIFLLVLLIIHFVLNSVDIYNIHSWWIVSTMCQDNPASCHFISTIFYTLKVHRFITLPVIILVKPMFYIMFIDYLRSRRKDLLYFSYTQIIVISLVLSLISQQAFGAISIIYYQTANAVINRNNSMDERLVYKLGGDNYHGWILPLGNFIKSELSDNEIVIIPPDSHPWEIEGNSLYLRSFIYPIKTINSTQADPIPASGDFVLITSGIYFPTESSQWPNFKVPLDIIEEIIIINKENKEVTRTKPTTDYINDSNEWGLIKLK